MTTPIPGGRANALPDGFEPSGDLTTGEAPGIEVDKHKTLRRVGIGVGVTLAGAGAALLATRGLRPAAFHALATQFPALLPAAIGAAAVGGALTIGSVAGLRPRMQEYQQVVDGSLREAGAAAAELGGDVGIVRAGDDRWGLLALEEPVVDAAGGGAAKLSNPPIRFAAVTSRDGDTWVRDGDEFVNRGSATAVAASSIDARSAAGLRGAQVAVAGTGRVVELGTPLFGGEPQQSRAAVVDKLFEAGMENAALVDTGKGIVAFEVAGDLSADQLHARGTAIHPVGAVTLLSDVSGTPTTRSAGDIGGEFGARRIERPVVDVGGVKLADAGSLVGRRVAGSGGSVERLGKVISEHPDVGAAITAAAGAGSRTLVAKLADGAAVYALPGSQADPLVTALGGEADSLKVVEDRKKFSVAPDGTVSFEARSVPFDTAEAIGRRLDSGSISGKATKLLGSYPSKEAALAAIRGDLSNGTSYVVVRASGPAGTHHAYQVEAGDAKAWDQQLGSTSLGAWRNDHLRASVEEVERRPSTWGTDLHYFDHVTERTVRFLDEGDVNREVASSPSREVSRNLSHIVRAFDPNEAVGHSVAVGGQSLRMNRWIDSTNSASSARARISASATDDRAYVVLERENNRGAYHIYEATRGAGGSSWNTSRADPELASWSIHRQHDFEETERRQGRYGTDVYHYDVHETWRERILASGGLTNVIDRTSRHVDRHLDYIDEADPPPPPPPPPSYGGGTSTGDDPPRTGGGTSTGDSPPSNGGGSGGSTGPGDSPPSNGGGSGGSGGSTGPGDSPPSNGGGSGGGSSSGNSTDNGNPSEDDF